MLKIVVLSGSVAGCGNKEQEAARLVKQSENVPQKPAPLAASGYFFTKKNVPSSSLSPVIFPNFGFCWLFWVTALVTCVAISSMADAGVWVAAQGIGKRAGEL
ncbi:MAG: hypothetical protein MZW92_68480 [Comamonadaceae bacterium]|nr:hypothetical protein [Comamonadaceae bacterium]